MNVSIQMIIFMMNGGVMKQEIIGFCEYFATGEGVIYVVASGSEEAIRDFAGPYFSIGLTLFSFAEMRTCLIRMEAETIPISLICQNLKPLKSYVKIYPMSQR
jgi:hypothetical protein